MRVCDLTGRLAADAERRVSKNGKEYLYFRMANNEYNDEKGPDGKPKTYWFSVTSFNHLHMTQYLTKGKPIHVRGSLSLRLYQTKEGKCEIACDIVATEIHFETTSTDKTQAPQSATSVSVTGQTTPSTQTRMEVPSTPTISESPKPTTAELKVPSELPMDSDDDDLPF